MEIRDIKERLDLNRVLSYYKLQPDKNNRLNCPFHKDKTPSMQVYLETNTVYCFSSNCKTHGKSLDVIDFIMHKEDLNKHDAIIKAKEFIGDPVQVVKKKSKENHSEIITKIFKSFSKGLQSNLAKNPSEYLQQRGLDHKLLELGYNSGQFHHRGRLSEEDFKACINAGLLVPYNGRTPNGNKQVYTAFANNCIIFPLKNKQNKIVSIYGRSLSEKKGEKHYYLKSRSGLYPGYILCPEIEPVTRRLILTEAIIDAATLLQLPKISQEYEILSLYGTNGLTEEHKQTIKEAKNLTEIIFFFDGDTAGRTAIEKYSKELKNLLPNIILSEVETPGGEDVNSLHQMYDNEEYFLELLGNRKLITAEIETLFLSNETNENQDKSIKEKDKSEKEQKTLNSKLETNNKKQETIPALSAFRFTKQYLKKKSNIKRIMIMMMVFLFLLLFFFVDKYNFVNK